MRPMKLLDKTGILLVLAAGAAAGLISQKALSEITIYNVNAIHELYGENELAAKKIYHNKNAIVFGKVDKVDNEHVIIEGDSEFGRLFCRYSDLDLNKVLMLREDSRVKVRGTLEISWAPWGMFLNMNNCRII